MESTRDVEGVIREFIVQRVAFVTKLTKAEIRCDEPVSSFGMDSLATASLWGELEDWLGCRVPASSLLGSESIERIASTLGALPEVRAGLCAHTDAESPALALNTPERYTGGENFDLAEIVRIGTHLPFVERVQYSAQFLREASAGGLYRRELSSATDREVILNERSTQKQKRMLMFGSNSYLGLANHPHVAARVRELLETEAIGLGGAPLLSGFTRWHRELEERLAMLKGTEAALLYSTGYSANLGLVSACCAERAFVICDEYSHASFRDGLKLARAPHALFRHNDVEQLSALLTQHSAQGVDLFVGVEGLYSMDGDLAPLDEIVTVCERYGATLIVDDAHATGVIGASGSGSAERFHVKGRVPIVMGTLSKALAGLGGFVCGSRDLVEYLRFLSRSYMFSTSMPPILVAQALGGLDVLEREPERLAQLRRNIALARAGFAALGIGLEQDAESPIFAVLAPAQMDIRAAGCKLHEFGIFVNAVEYPAVPRDQQRFRVSIMSAHTEADIGRMLAAFSALWRDFEAGGVVRAA